MTKYKNHFDLVFFSPPYYRLEMYEGNNQSTERYKTYEEWLKKYWDKTIQLCYHVLEPNGKICYIISDYGSHNEHEHYNLIDDMNEITSKYFRFISKQKMLNKDVYVRTKENDTNEQIVLFSKK